MSRVRVFAGTRLRQLSDATGDLQYWLRHLAYRVERTQGGTSAPHAPWKTSSQPGSRRSHGDPPLPLLDGMRVSRCHQDGRIGYLVLTPQQREALQRVGEQVQAINQQVHSMREARRKRDDQNVT